MQSKEILIEGMNCSHCVMAVKKELSKIDHLTINNVEIGKADVTYDESLVTDEIIYSAIDEAGFTVIQK